MKKNRLTAWGVIILILIFFSYSYFSKGFIYFLINSNTSEILNFLEPLKLVAPFLFIGFVILEVVLAPIPPLALYIVAGILFGGFLGGVFVLIGNLIGAFIDFKLAKKFGKKKIENKFDKKIKKKFDKFFEKYGGFAIFILRVNPITTSDVVSYLSGLTKIRTSKFLIATGLGLIPMIFVQTYLGDIFAEHNWISIITIIFSLIYLLIFVYLIILVLFDSVQKKPATKHL